MLEQVLVIAAALLTLTAAAKVPMLRRPTAWLWRRNVTEPLTKKADQIVATVVIRELKQRDGNGGTNLDDLGDRLAAGDRRMARIETEAAMHTEMLQSVRTNLKSHMESTAEQRALERLDAKARQGFLDRRKKDR